MGGCEWAPMCQQSTGHQRRRKGFPGGPEATWEAHLQLGLEEKRTGVWDPRAHEPLCAIRSAAGLCRRFLQSVQKLSLPDMVSKGLQNCIDLTTKSAGTKPRKMAGNGGLLEVPATEDQIRGRGGRSWSSSRHRREWWGKGDNRQLGEGIFRERGRSLSL